MSERESDISDDERINQIQSKKKVKSIESYQRASRPPVYESDDDEDEDEFVRQIRLESGHQLHKEKELGRTRVDPDGTVYEWDPVVKGWFPKVTEEFLVQHHMNYGLESSSGIHYDTNQQTYVQQRQGINYKLDQETQQWLPMESYTDKEHNINYKFSRKENAWIPEQSTYSTTGVQGQQQTYVWLKNELKWSLLSSVDAYTDHLTGMKYKWNNETQSWDHDGLESVNHSTDVDEQANTTMKLLGNADSSKKTHSEGWLEVPDEKNCNVYVTGLPLDITDAEFEELMSKYGIIAPDPDNPKCKKIRLYRDEQNQAKGDGRCRYLRPESVQLCIDMLDETEFRLSKLHVERAKFQVKGTFNPDLRRKRKKMDKGSKQKQASKLLDWEDRPEVVRHKYERIVVLKNLFDLQQFQNDPMFIDRLRNMIRDSCSEYGLVKKITIYDSNPDGIATVALSDIDQADACCQYMDQRLWNGRIIRCQTWDGKSKYEIQASFEEEQARIDQWHRYLNEDNDDEEPDHRTSQQSSVNKKTTS